MLELRDYQNKGVENVRNTYRGGKKSPLFVLPTGGGKTVVFSHIAHVTASKNKRVLILVHRVELLRQTGKSLAKSGVHHGLINPNYTPDKNAPVQVASVQTLIKRLDKIHAPDLIIIDEAHHATAGSWRKVIEHFPSARVLGVTATPIRGDGKGLGIESGGVFDSIIIGPQIPDLIDRGFLVKPIIYAPKQRIDFSSVKITRGDYDKSQVTEIMDRPTITGDAVAHYKKLCSGVPAVVFCVSITHAEHVAEEFRSAGYKAYSVDGTMDDETRSRILNGLGDGSIEVVTSCDLISEGTDIPAIGCAILLRPTQSTGLYLQQVGRALRLSEGKDFAVVLDHVGNVLNHGFPDDVREWSLEGQKKKNKKTDKEKTVRISQCESCFAVYQPANVCPYCGNVNKVKESTPEIVDGELEMVTDEHRQMMKTKQRVEVAKARTLADLKEIERSRGYKRGWANKVFSSRNRKLI